MKKLLISLVMTLGLTAMAQQFQTVQFLTGPYVLIPTNVAGVIYNQTNVGYMNKSSTNFVYSNTNSYIKATPFVAYNSNGTPILTNGSAATWIGLGGLTSITNMWTNSVTTLTNSDGSAMMNWPMAWNDVPLWSLRNGDVNNNLTMAISMVGTNASATNTLTFLFAGVESVGPLADSLAIPFFGSGVRPDLQLQDSASGGSGTWPVLVTPTGNAVTTYRTNIPSAFVQGIGAVRLVSVTPAGGSAPGSAIDFPIQLLSVAIEGYKP